MADVAELLAVLGRASATVAVAESLTGGLVSARLTSIPGASSVVRGAVVCYATELKASVLSVDADLLGAVGPVDPAVAVAMARGVAQLCGSTVGLAATGVAGPDRQGGKSVGTVFIALYDTRSESWEVRDLYLAGDRDAIRTQTVDAVVDLALAVCRNEAE